MHHAVTASIEQQTLLHFANLEFRMCVFFLDMWVFLDAFFNSFVERSAFDSRIIR